MEGINPEHKSAQSQTSTLFHYLSCFLITCWPKQWNIPQHKICVRLTSLRYLILVSRNTILLHMLVLKPRFNSKSAWIEGIIMHTLTTVMVGQTIIIWHITVHQVLHIHGFVFIINKYKFWHAKGILLQSCFQRRQIFPVFLGSGQRLSSIWSLCFCYQARGQTLSELS